MARRYDAGRRPGDLHVLGVAGRRWRTSGQRTPLATAVVLHDVTARERLSVQMWRPDDDGTFSAPPGGSYIAPWMCRSGQCGGEWTPRGSAAAGRCLRCGADRPAAPDTRAA